MVAEHHGRAGHRVLFDQVDDGHRVRPIADEVAKERIPVGPEPLRVREAGGERFQIAVYVGEEGQLHADGAPIANRRRVRSTASRCHRLAVSPPSALSIVQRKWFTRAARTEKRVPKPMLGARLAIR